MPHRIRRMREKIAARNIAAASQAHSANPVLAELEQELKKDIAELKTMESFSHRAYAKRDKFKNYWHHVSGVIAQDTAVNDPITRTMLVWASDALLVDEFIAIATYMVNYEIDMPSNFNTSLTSFIADSGRTMLAYEASEHFKPITATNGEMINALIESIEAPERQPNDEAYAKFLKELGRKVEALESPSALKRAHGYYEKAIQLHEKVGVKQDLTRINKKLDELEAPKE